jgi:hypothetical protein
MFSGETTNTNFIIFGLTRLGLEPTIYRTLGEHANHYATDVVTHSVLKFENKSISTPHKICVVLNSHKHKQTIAVKNIEVKVMKQGKQLRGLIRNNDTPWQQRNAESL